MEGAAGCWLLCAMGRCSWLQHHLFQRMPWKQVSPHASSLGCLKGCVQHDGPSWKEG